MAQKKSGKARQRARKGKTPHQSVARPMTRRESLGRLRAIAALGLLVTGGVWWTISSAQADRFEQDLSRMGQGIPAIVQVHDPNCAPCLALERETRAALKSFDDEDLTYLVASLATTSGQAFASRHGAGYATLLFFDGSGLLTRSLRGPSDRNTLTTAFRSHIAAN
ncbi:hypothetical protein AB3Y40_14050 [Yoonia sp. R2331]|uniref:hypothetical protein n=1 Tax=Yoonia sp. R2331 TaxID=3237238 RepID=UPI0034E4AD9B